MQVAFDGIDSDSKAEVTSSSQCESIHHADKKPSKEKICDIDFFMREKMKIKRGAVK